MAMGKRGRNRQEQLFCASEQVEAPGHPFYERLNEVLGKAHFDEFCEQQCEQFYHHKLGRPSAGARNLFPASADRLLRGDRQRAGHCLAHGR